MSSWRAKSSSWRISLSKGQTRICWTKVMDYQRVCQGKYSLWRGLQRIEIQRSHWPCLFESWLSYSLVPRWDDNRIAWLQSFRRSKAKDSLGTCFIQQRRYLSVWWCTQLRRCPCRLSTHPYDEGAPKRPYFTLSDTFVKLSWTYWSYLSSWVRKNHRKRNLWTNKKPSDPKGNSVLTTEREEEGSWYPK